VTLADKEIIFFNSQEAFMKKGYWLVVAAAAVISLSGFTPAVAGPGGYGGRGFCGNCDQQQALTPEALQAREEFMAETTDIRKQLAVSKAELRALMAQQNPDEKRVAALTGETFDLRHQLRQKAAERGFPGQFGFQNCRQDGGPGKTGGRGGRARNQ
jgi:Spy/CpxP family protein refolding chaperone